jgi:hypothetical protein
MFGMTAKGRRSSVMDPVEINISGGNQMASKVITNEDIIRQFFDGKKNIMNSKFSVNHLGILSTYNSQIAIRISDGSIYFNSFYEDWEALAINTVKGWVELMRKDKVYIRQFNTEDFEKIISGVKSGKIKTNKDVVIELI